MAAAKNRKKRPQRAGAGPPRAGLRPKLEQHHLDLIGLALVAFSAFLAFVLYMGAAGGRVGEGTEDGLRFLLGGAAYLGPPALCAAGRADRAAPAASGHRALPRGGDLPPARRHARPGRRLARARARPARPRAAARPRLRERPRRRARRAAVRGLARAVLRAGRAHPVPVPDAGRHPAGDRRVDRGRGHAQPRRHVATTTQRVRRQAERTAVLARDVAPTESPAPPEPAGVEPVVHATHVEAPALDAESRFPDLFGEEEPQRPRTARPRAVDEAEPVDEERAGRRGRRSRRTPRSSRRPCPRSRSRSG